MSIWSSAQTGILTKEKIEEYLQKDSTLTIDSEDKSGLTPLAYALQGGNTKIVELLLKNGAKVDKKIGETIKPQDLRTPLYLAATARKDPARCVQLVLEKNPQTLDEPVPGSWKDQTPLMAAVAQPNPSAEVIKLLRTQGASLDKRNSEGKSAEDIAQALHPQRQDIKDALKVVPSKQRGGLSNYIQGWVFSVLKYFNIWTPLNKIFGSSARYFYRLTSPTGVTPGLFDDEPQTAAQFKNNLDMTVKEKGLDKFFPPNDPFIKEVAENAAKLKDDPNNLLKQPNQIQDLSNLALYQPVLYCDDSGSMQEGSRWPSQKELIAKIANITSRAVPKNKGAHLRFINKVLTAADNLNSDQVAANVGFTPAGGTPIGTQLRNKILQPLIYDVIDANKPLERPYLIIITTDGCPNNEPEDTLRNAVLECAEKLNKKGYRRDAVMFCLNQIGDDDQAKQFLNNIEADIEVQKTLHRTSELLDDRYEDLKENGAELEAWLLVMLLSPLQSINKA
ncbi:uncharacterized protein N0V89_009165 [Didymosphaeria variabile]|uniref:Ankyrin n=1 Tax=Didymosphaeria variabile TaxID=1932322 RepID=A0A9W8XDE9_9PLEO|nr:uncharacterized protein N0V89_009165 [Didymosphaeria variabile]KAJ4347795.1 hypothetical protein N0V89_009165 [Didymosphaeria variabile]